ncbi:MAG: hypothetical protein R3E48_09450 [Burkholderiaceae bacterium]
MTETNHGIIDYLVVTSAKWWDGLKPDVRKQLETILTEVTTARNAESEKVNQANKARIIEAGGKVRTLNAEQRAAWVKALKPVWAKFEKDIGADTIKAASGQ